MEYKNIRFAVFCKNNLGDYTQLSVWFIHYEEALDFKKRNQKTDLKIYSEVETI